MTSRRIGVFRRLQVLYACMQEAYDSVAASQNFSCQGCENNCCTSFFQHHTHIEWAYLLQGLGELSSEKKTVYKERAGLYVEGMQQNLSQGQRPHIMCPLNDDGLCGLYSHRLMICRLHGVPHTLATPLGQATPYPGCFRFKAHDDEVFLDRTPLYRELACLEMEYMGKKLAKRPKVNLTLAEMIVAGKTF